MSIRAVASAVVLAGTLAAGSASAMPLGSLAAAADAISVKTENVRWVCGPYRCFWRPNYLYYGGPAPYYGFYGPRPYRYGFYGGPRLRYGYYGRRW